MGDFTPSRYDFRGGVKSKTHRRQRAFHTFHGFHGFSLEGYASACTHAPVTYLQRIGVKSGKSGKSACRLAVKSSHLSLVGCEIGCEIGSGAA